MLKSSAHICLTNPHVIKIFKALRRSDKPVHKIYLDILRGMEKPISPERIGRTCRGLRELGYLESERTPGGYMKYRLSALGLCVYPTVIKGAR